MESLETRAHAVTKCLKSLHKSIKNFQSKEYGELHDELRDSVIQRFEFSVDTLWKFLREYLETNKGIIFTIVSPKEVLRNALQNGILSNDEYEIFLDMIDDHNLTSHTYNEFLAEEIAHRIIASYYNLLKSTIERARF